MPSLFDPIALRDVTVDNRIFLSPMCQYMCSDRSGVPTDWHLVHLGARAAGGFGLIMTEATAVVPEGRISPEDCGLWNESQTAAWSRIVEFCAQQGAKVGVQLAHAGRKASTYRSHPGLRRGTIPVSEGGWPTVAPSNVPFPGYETPIEMSRDQIRSVADAFVAAARRADRAGFDVVEVHAAHGYLLHEFLSPLSNRRADEYGGDFEGRVRLVLEVVDAVRDVWPDTKPVFVRISATDWVEGGWSIEDTRRLAGLLSTHGVDLVDVSSGGNAPAEIPLEPGYQVPLSRAVKSEGVATSAVGLITDPEHAQQILDDGSADAIMVGRVALREPAWPLRAAAAVTDPADARYPAAYWRGVWPDGAAWASRHTPT